MSKIKKLSNEEIEIQRNKGDQYYNSNPNKIEINKLGELYQLFENKKEKSREIKEILTKNKTKCK
jgi:hypothetical protein|tara:strand:+ start:1270 stop:1464 length:195 start_codon:yes stop_codon:yes gene_type:complete